MKTSYLIILIIVLAITSCAIDEQCRQSKTVKLSATFYNVINNQTSSTINKTPLTFDSIIVKGLKYDSIKNKYEYVDSILKFRNVSGIYLPLQKFTNTTKFEIKFNTTIDTVTILHTNIDKYLSLECGCMIVYSIDTALITNNFKIYSVQIINRDVNINNAENLRFYK